MSLGILVNGQKVGTLVSFLSFLMPEIQLRKLLKLVYLIDEESVRQRAIPVTWLDYYAWAKGPVAPEVYAIKDGALGEFVSCRKGKDDKWHVTSKNSAPYLMDKEMGVFSEWERELIGKVLKKYGQMDADELTRGTHQEDTLWSQVVKENGIDFSNQKRSSFRIDLNRLNESDEEALARFEDAQDAVYMQSLINEA